MSKMFLFKLLVIFVSSISFASSKSLEQCSVNIMGSTGSTTLILTDEARKSDGNRILQKIEFSSNSNNVPRMTTIEALQFNSSIAFPFDVDDAFSNGTSFDLIITRKDLDYSAYVLAFKDPPSFSEPPTINRFSSEFGQLTSNPLVNIVAATYVPDLDTTIVIANVVDLRSNDTRKHYYQLYYTGRKIQNEATDKPFITDPELDSIPTAIDYETQNATHYKLRLAYGQLITYKWFENSVREMTIIEPRNMNFRLANEFIEGCEPQICFDSDMTGAASLPGKHYDLFRGINHWRFTNFSMDTSLVSPVRTELKPSSIRAIFVDAAYYSDDTLHLIEDDKVYINGSAYEVKSMLPDWSGPIWAATNNANNLMLVGPNKTYTYVSIYDKLEFKLLNKTKSFSVNWNGHEVDALLNDGRSFIAFKDSFFYRINFKTTVTMPPRNIASGLLRCQDKHYQNLTLPKTLDINTLRGYLTYRRNFIPFDPKYKETLATIDPELTVAEEIVYDDVKSSIGGKLLIAFAVLVALCFLAFLACLYTDSK